MSDRIPLRKTSRAPLITQLRLVPTLRVPDAEQFEFDVHVEVQDLCNQLLAIGWDYTEIAVALGTGRTSLSEWRSGRRDMTVKKFRALRALVARECRRAA